MIKWLKKRAKWILFIGAAVAVVSTGIALLPPQDTPAEPVPVEEPLPVGVDGEVEPTQEAPAPEPIFQIQSTAKLLVDDHSIEIVSAETVKGEAEIFIKAWDKDGKQLGFGEDGTVEIERVRMYNPPTLAWDGTYVTSTWVDSVTLTEYPHQVKNYVYNPQLAVEQRLERIVGVISKPGDNIVLGKTGNTVSSFVPDPNPETNTVDGFARHLLGAGAGLSWTDLVAAAGNGARDDTNGEDTAVSFRSDTSPNWREIIRGAFLFNTAAIPDADTISSASLVINGVQVSDGLALDPDIGVYSSNPASNTALASGDYDAFGTTPLSDTTFAMDVSWTAAGDNTFPLNAAGIAAIDDTGITKLGMRNVTNDVGNTNPTHPGSGNIQSFFNINMAAGTANDPELIVTHAASAARRYNIINSF